MHWVDDRETVWATERDARPEAVRLCRVVEGDPEAGKVAVTEGATEPVPPSRVVEAWNDEDALAELDRDTDKVCALEGVGEEESLVLREYDSLSESVAKPVTVSEGEAVATDVWDTGGEVEGVEVKTADLLLAHIGLPEPEGEESADREVLLDILPQDEEEGEEEGVVHTTVPVRDMVEVTESVRVPKDAVKEDVEETDAEGVEEKEAV